jgi:DNA-binding MarR family transcriptional regulator
VVLPARPAGTASFSSVWPKSNSSQPDLDRLSSNLTSQRLDKLENAGLITRDIDRTDRRRVDVQLTPAGVELVDSLLAGLMEHDTKILAQGLTPAEQRKLRGLLRKLLLSLEPWDAEG